MITELNAILLFALAVVCFCYFRAQKRADLVKPLHDVIQGVAEGKLRLILDKESGQIRAESVK